MPFTLGDLRRAPTFRTRTIARAGKPPLTVRLRVPRVRDLEDLIVDDQTSLRDLYAWAAPFIVGWDLEAADLRTGELVAVPPPAEIGWEALELLDDVTALRIVRPMVDPVGELNRSIADEIHRRENDATPAASGEAC